mmetsp:Transcript_1381/g.1959  ORF Transcript_1381/g.1959 Transcript_1381/m.1959 type:complete len:298 (+) Transcript_1381:58-951(+)
MATNQFGKGFAEDDEDYTLEDMEKEIEQDFSPVAASRGGRGGRSAKSASPKSTAGLSGKDLVSAVKEKYQIKLKEKPRKEESLGGRDLEDEKQDYDLEEKKELRRGFKYFLFHHHSCLAVMCVGHAYDLPRYARAFLFFFDLLCNLMFAVTLRTTGMDVATRIFLTVFLCLVISMTMSSVFRNCGFNKILTGAGCMNKCITICILMIIPTAIVGAIVIAFLLRQEDGGEETATVFALSCVIYLIVEVLIWYMIYDCCKSYCSCCFACCPDMLDDGEVAQADIAHKKKKAKRRAELGG